MPDPNDLDGEKPMPESKSLPQYRCHNVVGAVKIADVRLRNGEPQGGMRMVIGATIVPAEEGIDPIDVDTKFLSKHDPKPGGYYVVYKDGYASFSPAKAFEDGYTRV